VPCDTRTATSLTFMSPARSGTSTPFSFTMASTTSWNSSTRRDCGTSFLLDLKPRPYSSWYFFASHSLRWLSELSSSLLMRSGALSSRTWWRVSSPSRAKRSIPAT
jgi:hypothetical protein